MSNSLKNTCFLLQTLCLTQGFIPGRGRPQLEVIKLGPGKNPEVVAITKEETNQLEGMGSRVLDVGAVCRGGKDLANGPICKESLTTWSPVFPRGQAGQGRPCFSGAVYPGDGQVYS